MNIFPFGRDIRYNCIMQYDRFQQESIDHINAGHSVIVSAPTGAGKTAIAEHVIQKCLEEKVGVVYTAPIKALSNQKFRDFQGQFSDSIGILTGDVSINQNAPVLIMTTEILRNKILDEPHSLDRYSWVIFDEVHYIDNQERGTVWEESLIFLPKHIKVLCLSATIPNIEQFAAWLRAIRKDAGVVKTVIEEKRPVPLRFFYHCNNKVTPRLEDLRRGRQVHPNKLFTLINHVREREGLPCIYFVFGRKRAEYLAFELHGTDFLTYKEKVQIVELYRSLCERFELTHEKSAATIRPLIERGIAYHHAGMLPTLKEVIERLFTSRLLKVIFTTETFALGINMPSRSVVFDELSKYYGRYTRILKTRDFYQMAGRAGRRGMDTEGFVYCRVNPNYIKQEEVRRVIYGKPEEVTSQLNTSYATVLNLYEKYKDELYHIYPLSLHHFQSKESKRKEALRLIEAKLRLLRELGYIEGSSLTEKGKFAKAVYGYELLLTEMHAENLFEQLDEYGLGMIACAAVFEPRKNQRPAHLPKASREMKEMCDEIYERVRQKELKARIYPIGKAPHFNLAHAMWCWLHGENFASMMRHTDTDEGEIIRYFRMSIQILREIKDTPISPLLKDRVTNTIRLINRDIIDAEKQLREG